MSGQHHKELKEVTCINECLVSMKGYSCEPCHIFVTRRDMYMLHNLKVKAHTSVGGRYHPHKDMLLHNLNALHENSSI